VPIIGIPLQHRRKFGVAEDRKIKCFSRRPRYFHVITGSQKERQVERAQFRGDVHEFSQGALVPRTYLSTMHGEFSKNSHLMGPCDGAPSEHLPASEKQRIPTHASRMRRSPTIMARQRAAGR
jgi:hypothetical protein